MSSKQFIPASDLDFANYKQSLKQFLQGQTRFADYDFDGSNISVLIDLLAYNAYSQAHYLNMVGSEMFLDSAQLRTTIVSHAKELNYTPRSAISARCQVQVEIIPNVAQPTITIPKGYSFKTSSNASGNVIRFLTDQPVAVRRNIDNRWISEPITIFEGIDVDETFVVVEPNTTEQNVRYNQRFVLQSENVDVTSIVVTIKRTVNDNQPRVYKRAMDLFGLTSDSEIYFVRGFSANQYEIEFGDGVLGKALTTGNIVEVSYRDTVGAEGNGTYVFTKGATIEGNGDINVTTLGRASGGANRETDDSIKYNAVRHFQAQNRAVIEEDYETLIRVNFPDVQQVNVYGGERVMQYGKVIIVLKPYDVNGRVEQNTKERIIAYLKTKNIVPEPIVIDPEYFYVDIAGDVKYNVDYVTQRESQIQADIINALIELNETVFNDFDVDIHQSTINKAITDSNPAVTGSDISLKLVKRWTPQIGTLGSLQFELDNPVVRSVQGEYISPSIYGVTSSIFQMMINDVVEDVVIRDNGIGKLFVHVIRDASTLVKIAPAVGSIAYDTGKIELKVDPYNYVGAIAITSTIASKGINVSKNKYVLVDSPYINIKLVK